MQNPLWSNSLREVGGRHNVNVGHFLYTDSHKMSITAQDRAFLEAISGLGYCNPFLPERVDWERRALGAGFVEGDAVWSQAVDNPEEPRANVLRIVARLEPLAESMCAGLRQGSPAGAREGMLYEDAVLF